MTASVLKQAPNAKRFKRTLVYLNTGTQYANMYRMMCIEKKGPLSNAGSIKGSLVFVCVLLCVCAHIHLLMLGNCLGSPRLVDNCKRWEQFLSH